MPRVGSQFASYSIQGVLGRGGMSVVYRADNLRLGNAVALKVLSADLSENDAFRERFVRESRLAASINHPNIIPIYDAGEQDGLLYIAMRYVEGADLKALIRQEGALSLRRTADIVSQVARGLTVAHQRGLVHRDIKPANILTERSGIAGEHVDHVYLADFGLMKHQISRSGLTDTGQFLGTVDYVAPEQVEGRPSDYRADIYSLGCVLYECLTGSVPYPRDGDVAVLFAHVQDAVPRVTDLRRDLPAAVDEVVARAMAKPPERRYASAIDLAHELSDAVGASRYSREHSQAVAPPEPVQATGTGAVPAPAGPPPAAPESQPAAPPPAPPADPEQAGAAPMPDRARRSLLVAGLSVALVAALAVIGFQLLSGGNGSSSPPTTAGSSGGSTATGAGTTPASTFSGVAKPGDLRLVMPTALMKHCTSGPPTGGALATVNCTAPAHSDITYEVSLYRDTAAVKAAFQGIVTAQGIKPAANACTNRSWRGERPWLHPTGTLGGHVACYLDQNGDSVIVWAHESANEKGVPPQTDHRDILGIARQHTQLPGQLLAFWTFWGGEAGTANIIGKTH